MKDAAEYLEAGTPAEFMKALLDAATDFAPERVKNAMELYQEYMAEWFDEATTTGLQLPWDFPDFVIRRGELTVWTGIEKSGKTTLLGFALMALMFQGERAMVASMETRARKTLKKFSRQASGTLIFSRKKFNEMLPSVQLEYRKEAEDMANRSIRWLSKNLWIYDHAGIAQWRTLIEDIKWARRRHGITQFVVDNFMRLGFLKDDYPQQAECVTALAQLSLDLNIHIHLVVHQNKSEGSGGKSGGKRTVSGAFEVIANAHNIVEVQRDAHKGEKVSEAFGEYATGSITLAERDKRLDDLAKKSDGKFVLHAQREGDLQNGSKYLWFLYESQQYVSQPRGHADHAAISWVKLAEEAEAAAKAKALPESPPPDWEE